MLSRKTPIAFAIISLFAGAPIAAQAAPTVSFKKPTSGQTISGNLYQSSACEVGGSSIDRVRFYLDSTSLNTEESAPWQCNLDTRKFSNGSHTLRAVAYDSAGVSRSTQITVNIQNATSTTNTAPTVAITSPASGATVSGTSVSCAADASDSNGVSKVVFSLDGTTLTTDTTAPYGCTFDSTRLANGSHTLRAVATDALGATRSTQVSFNVSNTASGGTGSGGTISNGLSFKAPAAGGTISGNLYQSSACEVAPSGISVARVKFFLDGTALNTEGSAPWQCNLDTRKFANGSHTLKAQALNSSGTTTGTAQITVNIQNGTTTANTPPSVAIMKPDAGATLTAPVSGSGCEASASDAGGSVSKVDFFLSNGTTSTPVGSKTAAPYQCAIDTSKFANGTYTLMAVATDNQNATSSSQRSLTISKTATDTVGGGSTGTSTVASSDIITRASADVSFSQQSGYTAQVIKTYTAAPQIPETGIHGTTLPNGETLRLGKVIDPENSARKALAFQVVNSDPLTSGGQRSELSINPNIEMNKVYWIAFSAFLYDWGTLGSGDASLFGTQMHTGDNNAGVGGPSFGLYTTQNGRSFRVQARYSTSSTPSSGNSVSVKFAEYPIPFGRWTNFVVKFKHNTSGNGFLQVWMDGNQIANYQGSLGYNTGMTDYAKFGYYNWSDAAMGSTARKVLLRSPTIVLDPTGSKYSHDQVRTLLDASSTTSTSTSTSTTGTLATSDSSGVCSTITCAAQ